MLTAQRNAATGASENLILNCEKIVEFCQHFPVPQCGNPARSCVCNQGGSGVRNWTAKENTLLLIDCFCDADSRNGRNPVYHGLHNGGRKKSLYPWRPKYCSWAVGRPNNAALIVYKKEAAMLRRAVLSDCRFLLSSLSSSSWFLPLFPPPPHIPPWPHPMKPAHWKAWQPCLACAHARVCVASTESATYTTTHRQRAPKLLSEKIRWYFQRHTAKLILICYAIPPPPHFGTEILVKKICMGWQVSPHTELKTPANVGVAKLKLKPRVIYNFEEGMFFLNLVISHTAMGDFCSEEFVREQQWKPGTDWQHEAWGIGRQSTVERSRSGCIHTGTVRTDECLRYHCKTLSTDCKC